MRNLLIRFRLSLVVDQVLMAARNLLLVVPFAPRYPGLRLQVILCELLFCCAEDSQLFTLLALVTFL